MNENAVVKFMDIIESEGVNNISEKEFRAGFNNQKDIKEAFAYLKALEWEWIDAVVEADNAVLSMDIPNIQKGKKKSTSINQALNRRIRNLFSKDEIANMNIMSMSREEAEKLCENRSEELLNGTFVPFRKY